MTQELGLRERKKQRTRQHIAETAREAEVAQATVFNYFPTKEDLFYSRLEAFEDELMTAIRERQPGESVLAAFAGFVLDQQGVLAMRSPGGDDEATERIRTVSRVITESPALLARERQVFDRYAATLAAFLAEETGAKPGDVSPRAVPN